MNCLQRKGRRNGTGINKKETLERERERQYRTRPSSGKWNIKKGGGGGSHRHRHSCLWLFIVFLSLFLPHSWKKKEDSGEYDEGSSGTKLITPPAPEREREREKEEETTGRFPYSTTYSVYWEKEEP